MKEDNKNCRNSQQKIQGPRQCAISNIIAIYKVVKYATILNYARIHYSYNVVFYTRHHLWCSVQ